MLDLVSPPRPPPFFTPLFRRLRAGGHRRWGRHRASLLDARAQGLADGQLRPEARRRDHDAGASPRASPRAHALAFPLSRA
eukprot:279387-Pleurochrysis_carterae.AAC.1